MSWFDGVLHRIRTLVRPVGHAEDLTEEVRHHLELGSMHEGDGHKALRQFGNRTSIQEETRDMTWLRFVDTVYQDARAAWRGATRSPAIAGLVIGMLALGIGANAAAFSLLDALYLKPPAGVANPASVRTYWLEHFNSGNGVPFHSQAMTYAMSRVIAEASGNARQVAVYTTDYSRRLGTGFGGARVRMVYATANYFRVLGVRLSSGRIYAEAEDSLGQGAPVAVVSHAFWQTTLGGAPDVVGSPIAVGKERYTIVGVLEPAFGGLDLQAADVWVPLASMPAPSWIEGPWWQSSDIYSLRTIQRWPNGDAEGVVEARATTAIRQFNRDRAGSQRPDTLMNVFLGSVIEAQGPGKPGLELIIATRLGGVALIILVIAWANASNLLLTQGLRRRHETSIRLALGVSQGRLARVAMLETMFLALAASVAAMVTGWGGGSLIRALLIPEVEWRHPALDWRVAGFTAAIAVISGLAAGRVSVLGTRRSALGARRGGLVGVRRGLVAAQAALSVVLLVGAGLFIRSLGKVQGLDIGFDAGRLLFGTVDFEEGAAPPRTVVAAAAGEVAERLVGRPGIEVVARSGMEPMQGFGVLSFYSGADSAGSFPGNEPTMSVVSPSFFRATGIRIVRGRGFEGAVPGSAPSEVIVNETMATLLWPGRGAVGQCLQFEARNNPCTPVVGVVETVRLSNVIEPSPRPQYYLPLGSRLSASAGRTIVIRAAPGAASVAAAELGRELRRGFPQAKTTVTRMTDNLEPEYRPWKVGAALFSAMGLLALVVALIGIYSAVAYAVSQRTQEFGIRVALGAQMADVIRQVVGEGLKAVAIGVALGVTAALAAGRLIAALLYGTSAGDPVVIVFVSIGLLAVAAAAAAIPAWRAARTDPVSALRHD